jgi:hypothetical protein
MLIDSGTVPCGPKLFGLRSFAREFSIKMPSSVHAVLKRSVENEPSSMAIASKLKAEVIRATAINPLVGINLLLVVGV